MAFLHSFLRLQSTACEQQKWEDLLNSLDANFIVHLALGHWWVRSS